MEGPLGAVSPPQLEPAKWGAAGEGQEVCTSEVNSRGPTETVAGFEGRNVLSQTHLTLRKFPWEARERMTNSQLLTPPPTLVLQARRQVLGVWAPPSTEGSSWPGVLPFSTQPTMAAGTCVLIPPHDLALERTLGWWRQATSQQVLRGMNIPAPAIVIRPSLLGRQGTSSPGSLKGLMLSWKNSRKEENLLPISGEHPRALLGGRGQRPEPPEPPPWGVRGAAEGSHCPSRSFRIPDLALQQSSSSVNCFLKVNGSRSGQEAEDHLLSGKPSCQDR